jgi:tetratricopeptide (TPR) repeat protein
MESVDRRQAGRELSPSRRIDALCDRFELAWRAGQSPRIEEYLAEWPGPQHAGLFWELLVVELELRQEEGESLDPDDYRRRFPAAAGTLNDALRDCSMKSSCIASATLWPSPRPFLQCLDGEIDRAGLPDCVPDLEATERWLELDGAMSHSGEDGTGLADGDATALSMEAPSAEILTVVEPSGARDCSTEEIPGMGDQSADEGATTLSGPETEIPSTISGHRARADFGIHHPKPRDPGDTIGWAGPPLVFTRLPRGAIPDAATGIPGYELLEKLGEGGMGVVYKARQVGLNRLVAVKMIRRGGRDRPDQFTRFRIEAETIARLRHPHILQIHDIGVAGDRPFLALELLDGGSLADHLARTPQPGRQAARLTVTLARAIHAAHQAGIVHRDLKPSNVLFTSDGIPKISDFGLAKRLESRSTPTETGLIMGSPSYMAPEQARGHARNVGPAADVYSLGAIFYEMLTGRPPFKGATPVETVRQVADDDPVPPSRLVPRVQRDLETICLKCLSKEPRRRYESASDLADDLERHLNGEAIKARPARWWERTARWARRNPVAATVLVVTAAATFTLTSLGAWQAHRENVRVELLRREIVPSLLAAKAYLARGAWSDAQSIVTRAQTQSLDEPQLADLHRQADSLLEEVKRVRAQQEARETERTAQDADQRHYREFVRLRDEALVHDTQFTGLDTGSNLDVVRRTAQAALAIFAAPGPHESGSALRLPSSFSQHQVDQIREGCYVMLMVLAEAADQPAEGLRFLDQAALLRPPTRAYHLRRSACLSRSGDPAGAERERSRAEHLPPTTAFDQFLAGQERFKHQDWIAAIQHFDAALLLRPDDFWAHCLSAIADLQLQRAVPAKAELNACLQTRSELPWLYVLRAFASCRIAALARAAAENSPAAGHTLRNEVQIQLAAAEADYEKALKLLDQRSNDELRYAALVNRALLWLERRHWDKAVGDLEVAIALQGRH